MESTESMDIVVVYHPSCKPSTKFITVVSKLSQANIEYINLKDDKIDTEINIDAIPLMIVNNDPNSVFKGKQAFEKVEELCESLQLRSKTPAKDTRRSAHSRRVEFKEDTDSKKEKIDLSKK